MTLLTCEMDSNAHNSQSGQLTDVKFAVFAVALDDLHDFGSAFVHERVDFVVEEFHLLLAPPLGQGNVLDGGELVFECEPERLTLVSLSSSSRTVMNTYNSKDSMSWIWMWI